MEKEDLKFTLKLLSALLIIVIMGVICMYIKDEKDKRNMEAAAKIRDAAYQVEIIGDTAYFGGYFGGYWQSRGRL